MRGRRTDPAAGEEALRTWAAAPDAAHPRTVLAPAVRHTLELLAEEFPGGAVEVRVPPYGAVQAVAGMRHTRGTPPAVVEADADTWLRLVTGMVEVSEARRTGSLTASGERSDLSGLLPLPGPRRLARAVAAAHTRGHDEQ